MSLLWWAVICFVVAIVAGALGFGKVAAGFEVAGKWLFGIFLVLALILLLLGLGIFEAAT